MNAFSSSLVSPTRQSLPIPCCYPHLSMTQSSPFFYMFHTHNIIGTFDIHPRLAGLDVVIVADDERGDMPLAPPLVGITASGVRQEGTAYMGILPGFLEGVSINKTLTLDMFGGLAYRLHTILYEGLPVGEERPANYFRAVLLSATGRVIIYTWFAHLINFRLFG